MASNLTLKSAQRVVSPVSINTVIREFWTKVNQRLVKIHRIPAPSATSQSQCIVAEQVTSH